MPAGATMPMRAPKSAAELRLSPGQGKMQISTWLKAFLGAEAGYKAGRGIAGGKLWGVSQAPQCSAATGSTGDPCPEPQHAPAEF